MTGTRITVIGGGNMALAMCEGLIGRDPTAVRITIAEPLAERRCQLSEKLPEVRVCAENAKAIDGADVVMLAVKPQILKNVCIDLSYSIGSPPPLFISIAAGARISDITNWLGGGVTVIRSIPNQPALLGKSMTVLTCDGASSAQRDMATTILDAIGETLWVDDEAMIDTATAISGSGPAYFYLLMEIMIDSAVEFGYSIDDARQLVSVTAAGAAEVAAHETDTIAQLRSRVTSPGGTTAAALEALAECDIRAIFHSAIRAARERGRRLAEAADKD